MTDFLALASTDCERLGAGLFAQPTNTVSGIVFLLAGLWIALQARKATGRGVELAIYGAAVASNAVGGLLFHGLQSPAARWIHDLCIVSVLLFILVFEAARYLDRPTSWFAKTYVASLAGLGLLFALVPGGTYGFFAALGVGVGTLEVVEYRHALPVMRAEGLTARRLARLGALVALALGATAFFVGRSSGPLCSPGSVVQWHAVWHVFAAIAMALYAYGTIEPHSAEANPPARR